MVEVALVMKIVQNLYRGEHIGYTYTCKSFLNLACLQIFNFVILAVLIFVFQFFESQFLYLHGQVGLEFDFFFHIYSLQQHQPKA